MLGEQKNLKHSRHKAQSKPPTPPHTHRAILIKGEKQVRLLDRLTFMNDPVELVEGTWLSFILQLLKALEQMPT